MFCLIMGINFIRLSHSDLMALYDKSKIYFEYTAQSFQDFYVLKNRRLFRSER